MLTSNAQSFLGAKTMATAAGMLPVPSPLTAIPRATYEDPLPNEEYAKCVDKCRCP